MLASKLTNAQKQGLSNVLLNNYEQGIADFTRAIYMTPDEPSYYWHRAETYLRMGEFDSALQSFYQYIHIKGDSFGYVANKRLAFLLFTMAQCLLDQKRYHESEKYLLRALELGLERLSVLKRLAISKVGQGDYQKALEYLFEIVNENSADPDVYILRAKLNSISKNPLGTIEDLRTARMLKPDHGEIIPLEIMILHHVVDLKNNAAAELKRNDIKTAIWYLKKGLELDPSDWKARLLCGRLLGDAGEHEEGISELLEVYGENGRDGEKEEEIKAQIAIIHNKVAIELFNENRLLDSLKRFNIAIQFNPVDNSIRKNRATCHRALKDYQAAATDLGFVIERDDSDIESKIMLLDIYCHFALLEMNLKRFHEAKSYFDRMAVLNSTDPETFYLRGMCYFQLKQYDSMNSDFKACLKLDPSHKYALAMTSMFQSPKSESEFGKFPHSMLQGRPDLRNCLNENIAQFKRHKNTMIHHDRNFDLNLLHPLSFEDGGPHIPPATVAFDQKFPAVRINPNLLASRESFSAPSN